VRLMAPRFVRAYVKANKNDTADAEAICEAVRRPSMRFVAVKSTVQQDVQAVHWVRAQLVKTRIALANQMRGLLAEYGIVIGKGFGPLRRALPIVLENRDQRLSGLLLELIAEISERLKLLEQRLHEYDLCVRRLLRQDERCLRLAEVPGIGELTATALVATVGNAREFKSGRELAAYLGLVPRHRACGGRFVMLGISKRGDTYLRTLLIHGARAALRINSRWRGAHGAWTEGLKARRGPNIAAVALANKNARVAWKLLSTGEHYRPLPPPPSKSKDIGARTPQAPLGQQTGRRGALRVVADPNPAAFPPLSKSVRGRAENPFEGNAQDVRMCESHPGLRSVSIMVLADRSDRHSLKPATCRARAAIRSIRRECADFHRGLGQKFSAPHRQAVCTTATGSSPTIVFTSTNPLGRGPYMTRHSSLDDGCLQQGNSKERLSTRFYYASSRIRDVLAENRSASRRTKNP
jgi:transposase